MVTTTIGPAGHGSAPMSPRRDAQGGGDSEAWDMTRFVGGVFGLALLILTIFALPIALTTISVGQTWVLWVAIPHIALSALILGGILSAMFLMDAADDKHS